MDYIKEMTRAGYFDRAHGFYIIFCLSHSASDPMFVCWRDILPKLSRTMGITGRSTRKKTSTAVTKDAAALLKTDHAQDRGQAGPGDEQGCVPL